MVVAPLLASALIEIRFPAYCMFVSAVERALIKRGVEEGGRKVVTYVPSNFSQRAFRAT
jgi:hypothetical protein